MRPSDLNKRAELTVWPGNRPARTARCREFQTLRAALAAAAEAMENEDARPWIMTEEGDILSPSWIRANAGLNRQH
ncbi:hypothetical protein F6X53_28405 [Methylobacterium soli]|uniref:Uncharacterized protein n=1 Tax=Methylobacterium soli TaxID=553447 RepID=A0A6L3SPQ6_9HYPH|nr:hypothetical protein [Methylobacterium soli]KAB1072230.1 hypothetical protein F6X53_28405 [Methylobacterium soli]